MIAKNKQERNTYYIILSRIKHKHPGWNSRLCHRFAEKAFEKKFKNPICGESTER